MAGRILYLIACFLTLEVVMPMSPTAGPAASPPKTARGEFVAATLNIWHDQEDWRARMSVICDSLRALDPDVIFLQEVIQKQDVPNQAEALAESLGYAAVFVSVDPQGAPKRYGNAILTRHRIVATHEIKLEPLNDYRVAAHARLDVAGRRVDAYVTHLHHTIEGKDIRVRQIKDLLAFIDSTHDEGALVLGGDLNAAPDAPELVPIRKRLADSYALTHPDEKDAPVTTLNPSKGHEKDLRRIDYIFAGPDALEATTSRIFLDAPAPGGLWASDHFGLWTRFRWIK
jgi:endonuclease/exonuclease/phosphatase family metal-dependent hydrolase